MSADPPHTGEGHGLEAIFHRAVDLSADARSAYLDDACSDDEHLRKRVDALLETHEGAHGSMHDNALRDHRDHRALRVAARVDPPE